MNRLHHFALLALFATGCASTSTMGLARTLNKGAVQGWIAAEGGGIVVPSATPGGGAGTGYPMVEGGVRFGASDHVELGARLGFNGLTLEGKFALLRSPTMDSGINLSLNPMAGFFGLSVGSAFIGNVAFQLPLLIGIDFAGHELVFGPRIYDQLYFGGLSSGTTSGSVALNLLSAGGSIGFAIKAGPIRILPEVSVLVPFLSTGAVSGGGSASTGVDVGGFIFQAGIGFLFGTRDAYERAQPLPPPAGPPPPPAPTDGPPPMPPAAPN